MRISDWSSDVCSSDLRDVQHAPFADQHQFASAARGIARRQGGALPRQLEDELPPGLLAEGDEALGPEQGRRQRLDEFLEPRHRQGAVAPPLQHVEARSEEHTSELQSLMRTSYA